MLCAAFAANAETARECQAIMASNRVDRTIGCRYYKSWYAEQCTKAEHDAILERSLDAHGKWLAVEPNMQEPNASVGKTLAYVGRWKEARKHLEIAVVSADKLNLRNRTDVRFELANCLWLDGDKKGARKLLAIKDISQEL